MTRSLIEPRSPGPLANIKKKKTQKNKHKKKHKKKKKKLKFSKCSDSIIIAWDKISNLSNCTSSFDGINT